MTRLQVSGGRGRPTVVLTETEGPQNLEVQFVGERVVISVLDDAEAVVSIPRHIWDSIVEAGL